ncbi:MAG: hypothetical protein MJ085_03105 [Clostridia bacterium]|nr:hypothetical protein [Clostridia bacterium]
MKREKKQPETGHITDPSVPVIRSARALNSMEYRRTEASVPFGSAQMAAENRKTEQI